MRGNSPKCPTFPDRKAHYSRRFRRLFELVNAQKYALKINGLGGVSQLIGIGIGIGIGIELTDAVFPKRLADRVGKLSELRQLSHTTIEQCLLLPVVVCGHRIAHRQHVLNRSARQRRAACDFKIPASVPVRRFAVTLGPFPSTVFSADACDARGS